MQNQLDETRLLSLIEDQLDAQALARLKAELAAKPELLATIERMRADRAAVKGLPEPALSRDLLEALEPALARPVLLAPLSAAEYRRRHAHARRPRFVRYAVAAGLLLVLLAGVWAATSGLLVDRSTQDSSDLMASRTPGEGVVDQRTRADALGQLPPEVIDMLAAPDAPAHDRVTIHHLPPTADVRDALAKAANRSGAFDAGDAAVEQDDTRALAAAVPVEAPFVLVLETNDLDAAVALLSDPLKSKDAPISLVRNVTEEEVSAYSQMLAMRAAAERQLDQPAAASTESPSDASNAPSANTPARMPKINAEGLTMGEQIAGDPERAAAVEDQLRLSKAGVQYALTVPADRVAEALMAINFATGQRTSLRALNAIGSDNATQVTGQSLELLWIEQLRMIRSSLDGLQLDSAHDVVIPVRIDVREARR